MAELGHKDGAGPAKTVKVADNKAQLSKVVSQPLPILHELVMFDLETSMTWPAIGCANWNLRNHCVIP